MNQTAKEAAPARVSVRKASWIPPSWLLLGPAGLTLLLWMTSYNRVSIVQACAAFLLLLFPCWSYWHWKRTGFRGLPLFSLVSAMYWLYFVAELFWGDRTAPDWRHRRILGDQAITEAILLAVLGMVCLWIGTASGLGRRVAPKRLPSLSSKPWDLLYLHIIAAGGTLLSGYQGLLTFTGEGGRQIILILSSTVTITAIAVLLFRAVDGAAGTIQKLFLLCILLGRIVSGLASGMMGTVVTLAIVCAMVYLYRRHKLPVVAMAFLLPYAIFFQAGKPIFRNAYWTGEQQGGLVQRVEFWIDASLTRWQTALNDPSGRDVQYLLYFTLSRTSLLNQSANVLEQTPDVVPYQYGRLYSYLAVALIPRSLWPDKPSMSEANQFYQVAYGLTREKDLDKTSVAVGVLTEGYINFGWGGAVMVMFLIGILLEFWQETFLCGNSLLALGIGIALLPQLLLPEFQMAQYVSGLVQNVLLTIVVFLPVARWRTGISPRRIESAVLGMADARP